MCARNSNILPSNQTNRYMSIEFANPAKVGLIHPTLTIVTPKNNQLQLNLAW